MYEVTKQDRTDARMLAKFYGCKSLVFKSLKVNGTFNGLNGEVELCLKYKCADDFWSALCHELSHVENWHTLANYPPVHASSHRQERLLRRQLELTDAESWAKYLLEAELFIEDRGAELLAMWFPELTYNNCYKRVSWRWIYDPTDSIKP